MWKAMRWVLLAVWAAIMIAGIQMLPLGSGSGVAMEPDVPVVVDEVSLETPELQWTQLNERVQQHVEAGNIDQARLDAESAIATLQERLETNNSSENQELLGNRLEVLGEIWLAQNDLAKARQAFAAAEELYRQARDRVRLKVTLLIQSHINQQQGKLSDACQVALEAINFGDINYDQQVSLVFKSDEDADENKRQDIIATLLAPEDLTAFKESERPMVPAINQEIYLQLGQLFRERGDLDLSEQFLSALQKQLSNSPHLQEQVTLALANTRRSRGDQIRAQSAASKGIQFHANFCPVLDNTGAAAEAKTLYNRAIQEYQSLSASQDYEIRFVAQVNKFSLERLLTPVDLKKDIPTLEKDVPALKESDRSAQDVRLQFGLLNYAHTLNCYLLGYKQALMKNEERGSGVTVYHKLQSSISDAESKVQALFTAVAREAVARGNWSTASYAYGYLGEFLEFYPARLAEAEAVTGEALRLGGDSRFLLYQWEWQMARILQKEGNRTDSLFHYEAAYDLLQGLRNQLVAFSQSIQYDFRDRVEPLYREYVDLLLQPEEDGEILQDNLKLARDAIEKLQLTELDAFFQDDCTQFADTEAGQVDKNAAFFFTIFLPKRLSVITEINKQPLDYFSVEKEFNEVKSTTDKMNRYLSTRSDFSINKNARKRFEEVSTQVYDWLIRSPTSKLNLSKVTTLVFSLDDFLKGVPISALCDSTSGSCHYLIEKFAVAVVPSSTVFKPRRITDIRIKVLGAALSKFDKYGTEWQPLPNAVREIDEIENTLGNKVVKLLEQDFTTEALRQNLRSKKFSIVHLATHGEFSANQDNTFLLASDKKLKLTEFGEVFEQTVSQKRRELEVLLLSACKTAQSSRRDALGMAGVALRSGARSTVASLWSVNDSSTMEMISIFYKIMKAEPQLSRAEILRRAQIYLLEDENSLGFRSPTYWAPFILIGSWL